MTANPQLEDTVQPFAGRLGGQQSFVLNPNDAANAHELKNIPDAAPYMSFASQFDIQGFLSMSLWKQGIMEGMGAMMLVYVTLWISLSPAAIPVAPNPQLGNFDNAAFLGPLVGGVTNWLLITLLIYLFGAVTGGHLNPLITIATFCARLCSLPRMVIYVAFQTAGAALAGLLVRASIGTRDFKIGGCFLYTDVVPASNAFVIELVFSLLLLFIAFGVGLDPRQRQVIGLTLSPWLVGLGVGLLSFGSSFTRYGHGGASLNPARCFGAFVGSQFPGYHWIHWSADIIACVVHGVFYALIPPWKHMA